MLRCRDIDNHKITEFAYHISGLGTEAGATRPSDQEMLMTDGITPMPPKKVRGRPFEKGRSGNPLGRRGGCRSKTTIAAASLLAGEAEALTRKAVELGLEGEPTAMRLCLEHILPPCRDRMVKFALPPIESAPTGQTRGLKAHDIAPAMKAVTSALAGEWLQISCRNSQLGVRGRGGDDRGGGRHLCAGDRDQRLRTAFAAGRSRLRRPLGCRRPLERCRVRPYYKPPGEHLAADFPQKQPRAIIDSIQDCSPRIAKRWGREGLPPPVITTGSTRSS